MGMTLRSAFLHLRRTRSGRWAAKALCVLAMLLVSSTALIPCVDAVTRNPISADLCSKQPELFKLRSLTADRAARFAHTGDALVTVFTSGNVISGPCTRFVKTFDGVLNLKTGYRFVINGSSLMPVPPADPNSGPQPRLFAPPKNVLTIAADKFAEGHGRAFIKSIGSVHRVALWSGPKGSAIGILHCSNDESSCGLGDVILSSSYRIRDFGFIRAPHSEMHSASLWFWVSPRPGEIVIAGYTTSWFRDL